MPELSLAQKIVIWSLPILFGITLHEVAHGWMAKQLGDRTAEMLGRLTINPLKHIDPIGTVLLPLLLLAISNFIFGWARPVPVTWENLKHPRRDMALVALAGPGANLLMILFWIIIIRAGAWFDPGTPWLAQMLILMGWAGVLINGVLMILNLIPIPPLDGSRVVSALLPRRAAYLYSRLEPFGLPILLLLLVTGLLGKLMMPFFAGLQALAYRLVTL
jgi:Zn-dependent protease